MNSRSVQLSDGEADRLGVLGAGHAPLPAHADELRFCIKTACLAYSIWVELLDRDL